MVDLFGINACASKVFFGGGRFLKLSTAKTPARIFVQNVSKDMSAQLGVHFKVTKLKVNI